MYDKQAVYPSPLVCFAPFRADKHITLSSRSAAAALNNATGEYDTRTRLVSNS